MPTQAAFFDARFMSRFASCCVLALLASPANAQPANDTCANAIPIDCGAIVVPTPPWFARVLRAHVYCASSSTR